METQRGGVVKEVGKGEICKSSLILSFLLCSVRGGRHRTDNSRNILYFGPMLQVSW